MAAKERTKKKDKISLEKASNAELSIEKKSSDKDKNKKNTSLRLDKKTLKALKIVAIEQDSSVQKIIEGLIEDFLDKHNK